MANRWSHAHGKTRSEVVPFTWQPTPRCETAARGWSAGRERVSSPVAGQEDGVPRSSGDVPVMGAERKGACCWVRSVINQKWQESDDRNEIGWKVVWHSENVGMERNQRLRPTEERLVWMGRR
jgi:hypothetical protein